MRRLPLWTSYSGSHDETLKRLEISSHSRVGSITAVSGAVILFIGTWLHPMSADPNAPLAAFSEYAASSHWVASHMMQLAGVGLISASLVLLARTLSDGYGGSWSLIAMGATVASLAVATALQAVDGVALKGMVDRWAATSGPQKYAAFEAAFGVRQIEVGLAAMASIGFGVAASLIGVAMLIDGRFPRWLGLLPILGGVPTVLAGITIANTGFSDLAMTLNMVSVLLLLSWLILLGIVGWRRSAF
jgi:hypothetical protein